MSIRDDALYRAQREIIHLKNEISRLESRIRRLEGDLNYEIQEWALTLETGKREESIEGIKRRISRLKGALAYRGTL